MRHQHLEAHNAAFDSLRRHLNCGDVTGVVENRRCAVADLADRRDRHLAADERSEAGREIGAGQALQALELGAAHGKADRLELGPIEGAWRALYTALDLELTCRRPRRRDRVGNLFARRRSDLCHRLSDDIGR